MTIADIPPYYFETLALHDILTGIGFSPDQLYFIIGANGLGVTIDAPNNKISLKTNDLPQDVPSEKIASDWLKVVETWNATSQTNRATIADHSAVQKNISAILYRLAASDVMPQSVVEFACPFCGKHVAADSATFTIIHASPACEKFLELEPDDYLNACRKKIAPN